MNPANGPLAGLRVLDLGTRIAAPFCAGLLGEMGADVVKIEQPGSGDFMREIGPFAEGKDGNPYSLFWAVEGRGRRSVTLDLRKPEGQDVFRRLAATADVVVENFRPGTLERWNVAPAALDPRVVVVRISMFGQDGPNRERPGLDRVGIGFGGLMHLTGYPDRPPLRVGVTISDYLTGVFAAQAATAALYRRDARGAPGGASPTAEPDVRSTSGSEEASGGGGCVIDAALYGSVLRILEWTLAAYDKLDVVRSREGNRLANSAPLDNYPTRDAKHVCIVAGSDANFSRLCKAMGRDDLVRDPRFAKLIDRAARGDEINGIVADWTRTLDATDVEARCVEHDVPVATAYSAADIFADPHVEARGDLVTVDDPVIGPVRQQAPFPRFLGEGVAAPDGAPELGAHTHELLREIGIDDDELARLGAAGII
ncbi:MAG TPA: CaiB/BaiF CoA-transferase family protein [Acidimicrobiia bacterium]|jgi:crotonobetainyl-CoA:carnitine CoA-transferase CaiB-like acyl-CoA transferase